MSSDSPGKCSFLSLRPTNIRLDEEWNRKYPPDKIGEEMTDNARVWKVYADEAVKFDQDRLTQWNGTLDVLLLFVRLGMHILYSLN